MLGHQSGVLSEFICTPLQGSLSAGRSRRLGMFEETSREGDYEAGNCQSDAVGGPPEWALAREWKVS